MVSRTNTLLALCIAACLVLGSQAGPSFTKKINANAACPLGGGWKTVSNSNSICNSWIDYLSNEDAVVTGAVSGDDNCIVLDNPGKAPKVTKCCFKGKTFQAVGTYTIKCGHKSKPMKKAAVQGQNCAFNDIGC